uniref:Putative secreted protein n=1 Tax=Ixodes ricinus TaxID=34613 RepID=A0A6B0UW40_IXORI
MPCLHWTLGTMWVLLVGSCLPPESRICSVLGAVSFEDLVNVDNGVTICKQHTDDDIVADVTCCGVDAGDESENIPPKVPHPSVCLTWRWNLKLLSCTFPTRKMPSASSGTSLLSGACFWTRVLNADSSRPSASTLDNKRKFNFNRFSVLFLIRSFG